MPAAPKKRPADKPPAKNAKNAKNAETFEAVPDAALDALTHRQRVFVWSYTGESRFNATAAAKFAGYAEPCHWMGYQLKKHPGIRAAIQSILETKVSTAEEAMARTSRRANGNAANLLRVVEEGGKPVSATVDLLRAVETGEIENVKKLRVDKHGNISIELYDAQAADTILLRALGKLSGDGDDPVSTNAPAGRILYPNAVIEVRIRDDKPQGGTGSGSDSDSGDA